MRILILISIFFLNITMMKAQNSNTFTLTLNFEVTKHDKGQILFALYDSKQNHMKESLKTSNAKVENKKAKVSIQNLAEGDYSFSYFHDLDSSGKLNTNWIGIPTEPYGFSNGKKGKFGPPDFEDCKIKINKDVDIQINIK